MSLHWKISYTTGYLALGMYDDAAAEIAKIADADKRKDEVLALRVRLYSDLEDWESLVPVARILSHRHPENIDWWDAWAHAVRKTHGYRTARIVYSGACSYHPKSAIIKYNLGCYACLDGDIEEARRLIQEAITLDEKYEEIAFNDPDLERMQELLV